MAGKDDDIERLLAQMQALTSQADDVLGGDDATGKAVAPRRGSAPAPRASAGTAAQQASREGLSPALARALVVSGVATGLVWVVFILLPFVGLPLGSLIPVFLSSLLVAAFYTVRGRGR